MEWNRLGIEAIRQAEEVLGYLNLSSGSSDPALLRNLNALFGQAASIGGSQPPQPAWQVLAMLLRARLDALAGRSEAFRNVEQAAGVLDLVFDVVLPGYRRYHRDLLFHQTEESLFQPFLLGRVCEAVLAAGPPWDQHDRILERALARLNDFLGYRPVAVLRTEQKIQPYPHEWVGPIPLYVRNAGVAAGRYHDVVAKALEILLATDADLLERAWFDPDRMDELAVDPRAYDFEHPVHRRPNYQFGTWDPHRIDNRGHYRRYVAQEVTLAGLIERVEERSDLARDEVLFEAAAVLAGTILMGSGIAGSGPEAHDSSATLSKLVAHVAVYRDAFYERLLEGVQGAHGRRLRAEAQSLRQPFGDARQHLNHALARRQAQQVQHVHLARLFARIGCAEAALREALVVPVASARMRAEIDCRLAAARLAIARREPSAAAELIVQIEDLLHRAIQCGAMVDPWNILGFGGQFSRSPAPEDSLPDHRVDELLDLMRDLFALYARLEGEAAASGDRALCRRLSRRLESLAAWWDKYASTEVAGVEGLSGRQAWESAAGVADALGAWHQAATAAGQVAFWSQHARQFRSPQTYALLVGTLLEKGDLVAAMALLVHWIGQAEWVALADGEHSFHVLALRWMELLWADPPPGGAPDAAAPAPPLVAPAQRWPLARKFLDYLRPTPSRSGKYPGSTWARMRPTTRRTRSRTTGRTRGPTRTARASSAPPTRT